jgi:hypothetical protein
MNNAMYFNNLNFLLGYDIVNSLDKVKSLKMETWQEPPRCRCLKRGTCNAGFVIIKAPF